MAKKSEAYRDAAGRVVGKRSGRTFVRGARNRHFLKHPPAVSLDADVCHRVFQECTEMRVVNLDTGAVYAISVEEFQAHMRTLDRGFGIQFMVPLVFWRVIASAVGGDEALGAPDSGESEQRVQPRLLG